jgi:hypothetical protein
MTRLHDEKLTPVSSGLQRGSNTDQATVIPMVQETDFEQLARELNPQYYDIRRRPRRS